MTDYAPVPVPNTGTLSPSQTTACFTINTTSDSLVEGTESFTVRYEFVEKTGSFEVGSGGTQSVVSIIDDDCKINQ